MLNENSVDRIVRVDTHRADGRLRRRLRQHFRGNRRASVFRRHLGTALIQVGDLSDGTLEQLAVDPAAKIQELEASISRVLEERFSFACFRVDDCANRLRLEAGLIGLLAQHPLALPSDTWLGHRAERPEIGASGLWNTQHVASPPISPEDFATVRQACNAIFLPER
jgi:hypothetical protein